MGSEKLGPIQGHATVTTCQPLGRGVIRIMFEKCTQCHQTHSGTCVTAVCFRCGQTGPLRKNCPMGGSIGSVGQTYEQPRALV